MITIIMQHEVNDFTQWKIKFDADEPNRSKAGIKSTGLYTSVKNPNDITMIFETSGVDVLDTYTSDPRMQEAMNDAGVISTPVVSILSKV